jgi:Tol biopolymer transport system component
MTGLRGRGHFGPRAGRFVLALALTACGDRSSIGDGDEDGGVPDATGRVAYVAGDSIAGALELHVVNADGSAHRLLSSMEGAATRPVWSPDEASVAFCQEDVTVALYQVDADALDEPTLLVDLGPAANCEARWSPDGSTIAVSAFRDGDQSKPHNIHLVDVTSNELTRIEDGDYLSQSPTWSPDGSSVAFVRRKLAAQFGQPETSTLWRIDVAKGDQRQLTVLHAWVSSPTWSPTGEWIAFSSRRRDEDLPSIWIVRADGSEERRLTEQFEDAWAGDPSWSHDGRRIAAPITPRVGLDEIVVLDVDDDTSRIVYSAEGPVTDVLWGASGDALVFSQDQKPDPEYLTPSWTDLYYFELETNAPQLIVADVVWGYGGYDDGFAWGPLP